MEPDVTNLTHAQLLKLADELNIEITMFQLAREVLTLVPDNYEDVSTNISNPINYNLDETQIPEKLEQKHSWLIDLQDGEHCVEAKTEEEFWDRLRWAITVKRILNKIKTERTQQMTTLDTLRTDLESNVKDITVSQTLSDRLEIVLEPDSYDGPCLSVNFNERGEIDDVDFSEGTQEADPTIINKPSEFIQLQQILSIIYKYLPNKK